MCLCAQQKTQTSSSRLAVGDHVNEFPELSRSYEPHWDLTDAGLTRRLTWVMLPCAEIPFQVSLLNPSGGLQRLTPFIDPLNRWYLGGRSVGDGGGGTRPHPHFSGWRGHHKNCSPHFSVQKNCEAYSVTQHSSLLKAAT